MRLKPSFFVKLRSQCQGCLIIEEYWNVLTIASQQMHIPFIISILLSLLLTGGCQEDEPCSVSKGNYIQIGSKVNICLKVKTQNHTYVYAFGLVVDKLAALQISDIGNVLNETGAVTLSFQYQSTVSQDQIVFFENDTLGVYQNLISLVLQSNNGALTKVYYDVQDCSSCLTTNNQVCIQAQCFNRGDLSQTDRLLIYVSWIGTDLAGQHFVSHTLRLKKLSRFSQQNIFISAMTLIQ